MTPRPELLLAAAELADHLARVEVEVVEIERLLQPGPPDATYIWAIAAHLQAFYTGCESVIRRAVRPFEGEPHSAPDAHAQLLRQARLDVPGLRPAVVSADTAQTLETYMRFRHFIRNAYGTALDWSRMERKATAVRTAFGALETDVARFREFLTAAAAG